MTITDTWAFLSQATGFTLKFDYDVSGNMIYTGWATPGTLSSESNWRLMKQTFGADNLPTDLQWASGSVSFSFVWDNRASYTYK